MFYEIHSTADEIMNQFIPLVEMMNSHHHDSYSQPPSKASTSSIADKYSFVGELVQSISFGFLYGVGFIAARSLWTNIQQNRRALTSHHQDEENSSQSHSSTTDTPLTDPFIRVGCFLDKVHRISKNLMKRIKSSRYYKKSLGWITLCTMQSYYLSFVQSSSCIMNRPPSFFWSMYPLLLTVAVSATDHLLFDDNNETTPEEETSTPMDDKHTLNHPNTTAPVHDTRIHPQNDSLCSEINSHTDEFEPSIILGTSDLLVGKSRSDSIATLNSVEREPTSPYPQGAMHTANTTSATTTNSRYLELLVHNVSHTDLVLNLMTLPAPSILHLEQEEIVEHPTLLMQKSPLDETKDTMATNTIRESTPRITNHRSSWWLYNNKSDVKDSPSPPPISSSLPLLDTSTATVLKKKEEEGEIQPGNHERDLSNLILCRPRFSAFDLFCRRALNVLKPSHGNNDALTPKNHSSFPPEIIKSAIMSFPRYERSDSTRFSLVTPRPSRQMLLPVGLNLTQIVAPSNTMDSTNEFQDNALQLDTGDLINLRIRGRDVPKMDHMFSNRTDSITTQKSTTPNVYIDAVFFPLLSSLIRRWQEQIKWKFGENRIKNVKKVVILVSGLGTPRNFSHSANGNSTEACAELMEIFIHTLYPDVTVVRIHSKTEIFRYDENIKFATRELMPCIDAFRDAHARGEPYPDERDIKQMNSSCLNPFDPDWKQTFSVTLSFADGAPARTHAIQAALRPYRPQYFHFWQLKTFWHDVKICDDDIEAHAFEDMETVPAMEIRETSSQIQMVVAEVKKFREAFLEIVQNERNDIRQFWLRKTKKPVLAVLLVEQAGHLVMYRGTNMEVSMPTGSLCAERSVIGAAFASNPGLKREDLRMVAVLAVPLPSDEPIFVPPILMPSSPYQGHPNVRRSSIGHPKHETTSMVSDVENKWSQRREVTRSMSVGSFASIIESDDIVVSNDDDSSLVLVSSDQPLNDSASFAMKQKKTALIPRETKDQDYGNRYISASSSSLGATNPMRRIKLYADGDETQIQSPSLHASDNVQKRRQKRTVLVHFSDDLNPLRPCGACNEWLKKIAESNPHFKIITFTDADCNGVYVTPCQD